MQRFGNSLRFAQALLHLGILQQIFHQIKHVTSHSSPAKCFAILFSKMMDCLSFDKVQVKGEVLKAVRKAACQKRWSSGLTDTRGNVSGNGRSKSPKPLVVHSCVNILSVGTFCVKARRRLEECRAPGKCTFWPLHANGRLWQMWARMDRRPIVAAFLTTLSHSLVFFFNYLTPTLTAHNHSKR